MFNSKQKFQFNETLHEFVEIALHFTNVRCSHGVREVHEKSSYLMCNCLIFNVGHPGLEPGTSRL